MQYPYSYYDTKRHEVGFDLELEFAAKLLELGVNVERNHEEPFDERWQAFDWLTADRVFVEGRSRKRAKVFTADGRWKFADALLTVRKLQWAEENNIERYVVVWHSDDLALCVWAENIRIADCIFEAKRPDPERPRQFEDTYHVPVRLLSYGWPELAKLVARIEHYLLPR